MTSGRSRWAVLWLVLVLPACTVPGAHRERTLPAPDGPDLSDTAAKRDDVHLSLIRDMIASRQYYAALAHIQAQQAAVGADNPELKLLEADTRRNLGEYGRAEALYKALLKGALRGHALHGLGLLRAHEGNLGQAIADLRQAAQALPTDVDVRNDYGYALMQSGDYASAFPQLSTAAELAPRERRSRRNLVILMYLMNRPTDAQQLATRSGLDGTQLQQLQQQARVMQNQKHTTD
ncbi:MAG: hypothetical protein EPN72_12880 [Nevskiaceae bacterium]|nr:MAG: hypothetical protein EPN63_00095 [Nevskiaceae bacterium]TBR72054.1 MAG: hypothetical protein EPN72_12880 [Nevskiaceae bacterium]